MKNILLASAIAVSAGLFVAAAPAHARPAQQEKITIKKYGQTWRVTKSTAIARCDASMTDPRRKNWNIYCEYVPQHVAAKEEANKCQFLFWKTDCAIRNDEPQSTKRVAVHADGGIPGVMPGLGAKKSGFLESNNVGVLAKAESTIGLNTATDRTLLRNKLSKANGQTVDPARIPWCAAWMNMVLDESGMQTTGSLMARSFLAWGRPVSGEPKIGDVVVLRRGRNRDSGHVGFFYGFVVKDGAKMVALLGGNQGKAVGISYYPISKVIAYRAA